MRQDHCWQRQWLWVPDGHSWGAALYTVTSRRRENQKNNNDYLQEKKGNVPPWWCSCHCFGGLGYNAIPIGNWINLERSFQNTHTFVPYMKYFFASILKPLPSSSLQTNDLYFMFP